MSYPATNRPAISGLRPADLAQLESLLQSNHLPTADCVEQAGHFYGIFREHGLVAAGGLEPAGDYALLRSVVVDKASRGQGLGAEITRFLLHQAEAAGRKAVYLLTETAAAYFENQGFSRVGRDQVPTEIARTHQFDSLCPDTASCLVIRFRPS